MFAVLKRLLYGLTNWMILINNCIVEMFGRVPLADGLDAPKHDLVQKANVVVA